MAAGEVGARELTESALARIEETQSSLNAFRTVRAEAALAEAAEADRRLAAGERLPLLGAPIAVKDDTDLAGEPTAFGCPGEFEKEPQDGGVARRLKEAGAIIIGKTNTPEIGLWPFTEGAAFGATRNPWSLEHTPGGSSGGAAAAVAGGLVPAAVGSDGAGSVRIPAAWTNLVGVKPQRGRISTAPDPDAFNGLTVNGPLARTVADAALLLDVLSGNFEGDRHRPPRPPLPFAAAAAEDPGRLRIGLDLGVPFSGPPAELHPELRAAVERTADLLASLGHRVEPIDIPYGLWVGASIMPRSMTAVAEWTSRVPDPELLDPRVRESASHARFLGPLMPLARAAEEIARRRVGRVFGRVDVLLTPATAQPPMPVGYCRGMSNWETDKAIVAACPYAWPWNVLGWPGISVPAGFTEAGLPIGVQLLGPANCESRLLSLAGQLEGVARWGEIRPSFVGERIGSSP